MRRLQKVKLQSGAEQEGGEEDASGIAQAGDGQVNVCELCLW